MFDAETRSWSTLTPLPTGRRDLGASVVGCRLRALGGSNGTRLSAHELFPLTGAPDDNGNGLPDYCENPADVDGDGVANATDNCPSISNPDQTQHGR